MAAKTLAEILGGKTIFGRLTVVGDGPKQGKYRTAHCECECGTAIDVLTFSLTSGKTKSCGCLHSERASELGKVIGLARKRHGMKGSPEYQAWNSARDRCRNPNSRAFGKYGARGITMCEYWATSFEAFYADMGPKPSKRHTLERVDNSMGYEPGNCEWRLWEPQNRNRRNTVMVEFRGMTVPLAKLAARTKLDYGFLHRRIVTYGWDAERAIKTPSRQA